MKIEIHWKRSDIEHIAKHEVRAEEVEEVLKDKHLFHWRARYKGIICDYFLGSSFGRLLIVIAKYDKKIRKFRIKTVRDANRHEKKLYKEKR
jgi:uncharacterized DUF497 family protein